MLLPSVLEPYAVASNPKFVRVEPCVPAAFWLPPSTAVAEGPDTRPTPASTATEVQIPATPLLFRCICSSSEVDDWAGAI